MPRVSLPRRFYQDGCENCPFLELADRQDRVASCTTANFEGVIAMMKPDESWVARWEGINRNLPGARPRRPPEEAPRPRAHRRRRAQVYAMKLTGQMPEQIRQFLSDKRISCRAATVEAE